MNLTEKRDLLTLLYRMRSVICFEDRYNLELGHMDENELAYQEPGSRRRRRKVEMKPTRGWETFEPLTNVFWLHYLLHVLLDRLRRRPESRGWRFPLPEGSGYLLKVDELQFQGSEALRCLELVDLQLSREVQPTQSNWMIDSASALVTMAHSQGFIEIEDYLEG